MPGVNVMFNRDGGESAGAGDNGGDAGGASNGEAGKTNDDKGDGNGDGGKADDKKLSYDELELRYLRTQRALKKANKEAETRRKELDEARGRANGKKPDVNADAGDGGETAQLKKELADAQDKSRKRIVRAAVMIEAARLGFHDPADAFALADLSAVEIDDESDDVTGVDDALKELAKRKPHLVKAEDSTNGNGKHKPTKPDTNAGNKGGNKAGDLQVDEEAIRRKYSIRS